MITHANVFLVVGGVFFGGGVVVENHLNLASFSATACLQHHHSVDVQKFKYRPGSKEQLAAEM